MARDLFADEARGLDGADHLARKNMKFAGSAFPYVQGSAILLGIVFDDAEREARTEIDGVLRGGNGSAAIVAHGGEAGERHRAKVAFVKEVGIRRRHRLVRVRGGPVIGVLSGAEERLR